MNSLLYAVLTGAMIVLGICMFLCLIRVIRGPRLADRIVAVNMIGTMTDVIIIMLSVILDEGWLLDVAILYTLLSFVAVIVLTKIYMGAYTERNMGDGETEDKEAGDK